MLRWVLVVLLLLGATGVIEPAAAPRQAQDRPAWVSEGRPQQRPEAAGAPAATGAPAAASATTATDQAADEFAAIDAHALADPPAASASISSLAAYLAEPARDERDTVRAIFRWITANIAYDISQAAASCDPDAVLIRRRTVCQGYATLFKALANAAGMKAEVIIGHSDKFKYSASLSPPAAADGRDDWVNHAWNAVEVGGRWQLVDCCWGAGYLDAGGQFVRRFTPHYLLTAPQVFVSDHLPRDPRWQLLDSPISSDEYVERVQVRPPFFECGLRLASHSSATIETEGPLAVAIGAPADTLLTACLYRDDELQEGCTFTQRDADGYAIHARFPTAGDYTLRLFARRSHPPGDEYAWALDYRVRARSGDAPAAGFPKTYNAFLARNCRVEGSLSETLRAGDGAEFCVTAPSAQDVVVATGGSLINLPGEGSRFAGKVPVAAGPVLIFARFGAGRTYEGLLEYTAQ